MTGYSKIEVKLVNEIRQQQIRQLIFCTKLFFHPPSSTKYITVWQWQIIDKSNFMSLFAWCLPCRVHFPLETFPPRNICSTTGVILAAEEGVVILRDYSVEPHHIQLLGILFDLIKDSPLQRPASTPLSLVRVSFWPAATSWERNYWCTTSPKCECCPCNIRQGRISVNDPFYDSLSLSILQQVSRKDGKRIWLICFVCRFVTAATSSLSRISESYRSKQRGLTCSRCIETSAVSPKCDLSVLMGKKGWTSSFNILK